MFSWHAHRSCIHSEAPQQEDGACYRTTSPQNNQPVFMKDDN